MVFWSAGADTQLGKLRVKFEGEVNGNTNLTEVNSEALFANRIEVANRFTAPRANGIYSSQCYPISSSSRYWSSDMILRRLYQTNDDIVRLENDPCRRRLTREMGRDVCSARIY